MRSILETISEEGNKYVEDEVVLEEDPYKLPRDRREGIFDIRLIEWSKASNSHYLKGLFISMSFSYLKPRVTSRAL